MLLDKNQLVELPDAIGGLKQLTELSLAKNRMFLLPLTEALAGCSSLTVVDLSHNGLETTPAVLFYLPALTTLKLHHNEITAVDPLVVQSTALDVLDISFNKLRVLPALPASLTAVFAQENELINVEALADLPMLERLNLASNEIQELPDSFFSRLAALQHIILSNNPGLVALPSLAGCVSLTNLTLEGCGVKAMPPSLAACRNLEVLRLRGNAGLAANSLAVATLVNLTKLSLCQIGLTLLPDGLSELSSLHTLDLRRNKLMADVIDNLGLPNLHRLYLSGNPLGVVPVGLELMPLTELGLSSTLLDDATGVDAVTSLTFLNLSSNKLTFLPEHLADVVQLRNLQLQENYLGSLPKTIGALTNLERLDVSDNDIRSLPPELAHCKRLVFLEALRGNPIIFPPRRVMDAGLEAIMETLRKRLGSGDGPLVMDAAN